MASRVGIHEQWLIGIGRAIEEQTRPEGQRALMVDPQIVECRHRRVEVEHLRPGTLWPGWLWQMRHLLECEARRAIHVTQHQPVLASGVRGPIGRRFVASTVLETQQLPIELGQRSSVFAIEYDLTHTRRGHNGVAHLYMFAEQGSGAGPVCPANVPALLLGGAKSQRRFRDRLTALPAVDAIVYLPGQAHGANLRGPDQVAEVITDFAGRLD
jgi:hypothetical protein